MRLPFGGSPCPSEFCLFSDIITESINDITACKYWNPEELASAYLHKTPAQIKLPSNIPFAKAKEMSVDMIKGRRLYSGFFYRRYNYSCSGQSL